ncbi:hypothetical protein [Legionella quinlivanii]|nr:hypothetical protein [Legionella quinlivanii]
MVSDDTMEPIYSKGDFVGGIQYLNTTDIEKCIGHDCIIEISEGTYFRRLMKRKNGFALTCLNAQTEIEDPVIFSKKILAATLIIWHRWKFNTPHLDCYKVKKELRQIYQSAHFLSIMPLY